MGMVGFYSYLLLFLLPLLGLTAVGQEDGKFLHLYEPTHSSLPSFSHITSPLPVAVSLSEADLLMVSSSVILAERWLRSHILAHYPSTNISTIVVGRGVLCNQNHEVSWGLVLPSVKNMHYSLVRWGLVREIKVSIAFSSHCLDHHSSPSRFRVDLAEKVLKPLLCFLQDYEATYSINQPYSSETADLVVSTHQSALQRMDFPHIRDIKMIKEGKPMSRRLSSLISTPYPEKPKPLGSPVPVNMPKSSFPPSQFALAPDGSLSFVPEASPSEVPTNPPDTSAVPLPPLPPCQATPAVVPAPQRGEEEKGGLWCVAKPSVPSETLQEAMDYACGEGGADCEAIMPHGSCYYPDTVVSHASFAFNSYWQKTKRSGGSCNFEGTAILVNSNPSFLHCRFLLT